MAGKTRRKAGSQRGMLRRVRALPVGWRKAAAAAMAEALAAVEARAAREGALEGRVLAAAAVAYSREEERVARWLDERTGIGGGPDPIGFLMASHDVLAARAKHYRQAVEAIALGGPRTVGREREIAAETIEGAP